MTRAELFEAIRPFAPQKRFTNGMVQTIDALADAFGLSRLEGATAWLPLALDLIKRFEGCRLVSYPDPATGGVPWTVGYGSTGPGIGKGVSWTQEQADARLASDVKAFADGVDEAVAGAATTANQKAALVSLSYNIGLANLKASTLLKAHRAGDYAKAKAEFAKWRFAAHQELPGLVKRRAAEAQLYGSEA